MLFMLIVIFLPGGLMEGARRIRGAVTRAPAGKQAAGKFQPAE